MGIRIGASGVLLNSSVSPGGNIHGSQWFAPRPWFDPRLETGCNSFFLLLFDIRFVLGVPIIPPPTI